MVVYSYTVATGNKLDVNKPRVSHDTLISKLAQSLTPHQRSPTHGDGARRRSPAAPPALPPPPTSSRMLCAQRGGRSRRDSVALESCSSATVRRLRAERCNTPLARAALDSVGRGAWCGCLSQAAHSHAASHHATSSPEAREAIRRLSHSRSRRLAPNFDAAIVCRGEHHV